MLRIRYTKTKHGYKSNVFPISANLLPYIEINHDAEVFIKSNDSVIYYEQCTNIRNAKYRARKFIERLGFPLLTEKRIR